MQKTRTHSKRRKSNEQHSPHTRRDDGKKNLGRFFLLYLCQQRLVLIFSHVFCFAARCCRRCWCCCRCCSKIKRCETGPLVCRLPHTDTVRTRFSLCACSVGCACVCSCADSHSSDCSVLTNATIIITATSSPSDKLVGSHARKEKKMGCHVRWTHRLCCEFPRKS